MFLNDYGIDIVGFQVLPSIFFFTCCWHWKHDSSVVYIATLSIHYSKIKILQYKNSGTKSFPSCQRSIEVQAMLENSRDSREIFESCTHRIVGTEISNSVWKMVTSTLSWVGPHTTFVSFLLCCIKSWLMNLWSMFEHILFRYNSYRLKYSF